MHNKFKLVSLDNESSAGTSSVGQVHEFQYFGKRFYFGSLYSSTVSQITYCDGTLVVTTRNSVYTFERESKNDS